MELLRSVVHKINARIISVLPPLVGQVWVRLWYGEYAARNYQMYLTACKWLALQQIEGDIVEFGVGSGMTAGLLATAWTWRRRNAPRRLWLFDTFTGLPEPVKGDVHPQWQAGAWAYDTEQVRSRLAGFGLHNDEIRLVVGRYEEVLVKQTAAKLGLGKVALVHIDCDLKQSTRAALEFLVSCLQPGTMLLMDDYFCYSGDPNKGEAGALHEWAAEHGYGLNQWYPYSFHGQAWIVFRV